jgi:ABC-2 type transport system ATP-binding protein
MSQNIVSIEKLYHRYARTWAIQDINFEIHQRGVMGLLGSNGAGKSTTMNIMCGVLNQTSGNVWIDGINLKENPLKAKKLIGFLPQAAPLQMDLTVDEYLVHCSHLREMPGKDVPRALDEAKQRCGITHFSKRLIRNLSGGYRQRVGIAQAIIHRPKLVVLDEPTNGLDPNQITEVRALIKEIATDRSVIFSSHILSEIQATCEEVKMIEGGQMVFSDTMDAFNNYIAPGSLLAVFEIHPSIDELMTISGITDVMYMHGNTFRLKFKGPKNITEQVIRLSILRDWKLQEIMLEKSSLDEIFAQLSSKQKTLRPSDPKKININ